MPFCPRVGLRSPAAAVMVATGLVVAAAIQTHWSRLMVAPVEQAGLAVLGK